jgi:hypothetical protein
MSWIWLNIPLAIIFGAFAVGLPLWVTVKFPEDGRSATTPRQEQPREQSPVLLPSDKVLASAG